MVAIDSKILVQLPRFCLGPQRNTITTFGWFFFGCLFWVDKRLLEGVDPKVPIRPEVVAREEDLLMNL